MSLTQPAPDWSEYLERDEKLLWAGRPDFTSMLVLAAVICIFGLMVTPAIVLSLGLPIGVFLAYAHDAYALTNRRILALRQPFWGASQLETLPRAGTYAGPQMDRGPRAVWFTAPDRRKISFRLVSRDVQRLIVASYPLGGPIALERPSL